MRHLLKVAAVAAMTIGGGSPATAALFDEYTSFHVLGDSLSDTGRVYDLTSSLPLVPATPASPPYYNGRFSDGPVWAEHIAADFEDTGRPTSNYAWGGAEASGYNNPVPDIRAQAVEFWLTEQGNLGARPLIAMLAGANDLFTTIGKGDSEAAGRTAASTVGDVAGYLADLGLNDFLLFDLPNLGDIPRYLGTDNEEEATRATLAYNTQFYLEVDNLRSRGANVTVVDAFDYFGRIIDDPAQFGLTNVTDACYSGGVVCANPEEYLFFDRMHPTETGHRIIAERVRDHFRDDDLIAVIPLPAPAALLLGALAGLGFVGRRRRAA